MVAQPGPLLGVGGVHAKMHGFPTQLEFLLTQLYFQHWHCACIWVRPILTLLGPELSRADTGKYWLVQPSWAAEGPGGSRGGEQGGVKGGTKGQRALNPTLLAHLGPLTLSLPGRP